jgi:hypothetical protein
MEKVGDLGYVVVALPNEVQKRHTQGYAVIEIVRGI